MNSINLLTAPATQPEELEENTCSVCLTDFGMYANALSTRACKHTFHVYCIKNALEHQKKLTNRTTCPLCRTELNELAKTWGIGLKELRRDPFARPAYRSFAAIVAAARRDAARAASSATSFRAAFRAAFRATCNALLRERYIQRAATRMLSRNQTEV